jgi:hypothetical protein
MAPTAARMRVRHGTATLVCLALVATGCGAAAPAAVDRSPPTSSSEPPTAEGTGLRTKWPIEHVVFIVKENCSFDTMFGRFPGVNGVTFGWDHGVRRPLTRGIEGRAHDLPHCFNCALAAIDGGKMDGFNQSEYADRYAYTQFRRNQLPNYWPWAREFVVSDNFFASATGPSFPNHLYTIAAQAGGAIENPWQPPASLQAMLQRGLARTWGCDIPKGGYVEVIDPEGRHVRVDPCFDFATAGDGAAALEEAARLFERKGDLVSLTRARTEFASLSATHGPAVPDHPGPQGGHPGRRGTWQDFLTPS